MNSSNVLKNYEFLMKNVINLKMCQESLSYLISNFDKIQYEEIMSEIKSVLNSLKTYNGIEIEEYQDLYHCIEATCTWLDWGDKKLYTKEVYVKIPPFINHINGLILKLKPKMVLELKSTVISILKRYSEFENQLFEELNRIPLKDNNKYNEILWLGNLKRYSSMFLDISNDLKIIPAIEYTKEYKTIDIADIDIDIETLSNIPQRFQKLKSNIKKDFGIIESDLLDTKMEDVSNRSPQVDESKTIEVKPKHVKELEELEALHKELTSKGFLKRQVDTMRDVMDSISKDAGLILQIELFKGNLTEENREFLDTTYRIKDNLKNMPGEVQPDEVTEKTIREYSFDLKSFIKRQRENRGIA